MSLITGTHSSIVHFTQVNFVNYCDTCLLSNFNDNDDDDDD